MSDIALPRDRLAAASAWLRRYGLASFGAAIILAWVLAAIFAPWLTRMIRTSSTWRGACGRRRPATGSAPTRWGATWRRACIYGARVSLTVGMVVVLVGALFGTLLGAVAAYARGWAEEGLMRLTDLVLLLPADHPGDGDRRRARNRHGEHRHRDAGGVVAEIRPAFPQPGDLAALHGIRRGGAVHRLRPGPHPAAPDHPQRRRAADRAGHARPRQRHPGVRRAVLPRPGHGAADAGMGFDGRRRARAGAAMVGGHLSRAWPS